MGGVWENIILDTGRSGRIFITYGIRDGLDVDRTWTGRSGSKEGHNIH